MGAVGGGLGQPSGGDAPPQPVAPSGRQLEIRRGQQRAVLVEVGGGVRTYRVGEHDVLDGYGAGEMCTAARGQPLIPWPNRLHRGAYDWDGEHHQTPIDEPDKGNALHGFTRWRNWTLARSAQESAVVALRLHPQEGYPFALDLTTEYALDDAGLTVTTTARNVGARACPYAHGAHPYLTVGTERIDAALLQLPAATWLPTDEAQIPTGRRPVEGTPYDFRQPRRIGNLELDYAFTDLRRDGDGLARVVLTAPDGGRSATLWVDEHYPYLEIFTADAVPEPQRRRGGLGVEPMTCPPNGFATGEDVRRLAPGEALTTRWGISPS